MLGKLIQLAFDWLDGQSTQTSRLAPSDHPAEAPSLQLTESPRYPLRSPSSLLNSSITPPRPENLRAVGDQLQEQKPSAEHRRRIVIQGQTIDYLFERSQRRTIGFIIGTHGLAVRAPRTTSMQEIESAITEKATWILKHLNAIKQRQASTLQAPVQWHCGMPIEYLGEHFTLQLGALATQINLEEKRIYLALPSHAESQTIQAALQLELKRMALTLFECRLNHYAPQLNVRWRSLKLTNAKGRWGSAKSDGTIRLHWRLMHYRLAVIDYVVVHELSHLRHMNHSAEFWQTVASILPNYKALKKELRH